MKQFKFVSDNSIERTSNTNIGPAVIEGENITKVLGINPKEIKTLGENIHDEISARWGSYITEGLNKEELENLLKKHLIAENCSSLQAPKLNGEMEACLSREARKQEFFLSELQNKLGSALSVIGLVISAAIGDSNNFSITQWLPKLAESSQILCDTHHSLSLHRRFLIKSLLKGDSRKVISEAPIDKFLFGSNLSESIKTNQSLRKAGRDLKNSPFFNKSSNYKSDAKPGPSGVQNSTRGNKFGSYLNYQRPAQDNSRKKKTEYNRYPRKYHQTQTRHYSRGKQQ